jgi:hypothetical protein
MPQEPNRHVQHSLGLLAAIVRDGVDPDTAAVLRQEASVHAMLAIAEELADLREQVGTVRLALEDAAGNGAGLHLHYISEWLKDISERR